MNSVNDRLASIEACLERVLQRLEALEPLRHSGEFVNIAQAGRICGVRRRTIYNWIDGGKVEVKRTPSGLVRISAASLLRHEQTRGTT